MGGPNRKAPKPPMEPRRRHGIVLTGRIVPGSLAREFATVSIDDLSGLRVLLAEDELHVLLLIEDFLKELGCEVQAVTTVDDALAAAASADVDAAVLDVNLHGRKSFPA